MSGSAVVLTPGCIAAGIGQRKFRNRLSSHDMGVDDLVDVFQRDPAVPYCVRVRDDRGTMLALLQTSRLIGANSCIRDLTVGQLLLERFR
jgi:hypothetical protein